MVSGPALVSTRLVEMTRTEMGENAIFPAEGQGGTTMGRYHSVAPHPPSGLRQHRAHLFAAKDVNVQVRHFLVAVDADIGEQTVPRRRQA